MVASQKVSWLVVFLMFNWSIDQSKVLIELGVTTKMQRKYSLLWSQNPDLILHGWIYLSGSNSACKPTNSSNSWVISNSSSLRSFEQGAIVPCWEVISLERWLRNFIQSLDRGLIYTLFFCWRFPMIPKQNNWNHGAGGPAWSSGSSSHKGLKDPETIVICLPLQNAREIVGCSTKSHQISIIC